MKTTLLTTFVASLLLIASCSPDKETQTTAVTTPNPTSRVSELLEKHLMLRQMMTYPNLNHELVEAQIESKYTLRALETRIEAGEAGDTIEADLIQALYQYARWNEKLFGNQSADEDALFKVLLLQEQVPPENLNSLLLSQAEQFKRLKAESSTLTREKRLFAAFVTGRRIIHMKSFGMWEKGQEPRSEELAEVPVNREKILTDGMLLGPAVDKETAELAIGCLYVDALVRINKRTVGIFDDESRALAKKFVATLAPEADIDQVIADLNITL